MKIKQNHDNIELYCIESKELIEIGEKYVEVEEEYQGEIIIKTYKMQYCPTDEEDEDPYIGE